MSYDYDDYDDYKEEQRDDWGDKDDNEDSDDMAFVSEWNAKERVGGRMKLTDDFITSFGKGMKGKEFTPDQIFLKGIQKTIDAYELTISDKDLDLIKNKLVYKINLIKFKNPSAFIFAFVSLDNKYNINKEKIEKTFQVTQNQPVNNLGLDASFITKEDMIRYARLIKQNL